MSWRGLGAGGGARRTCGGGSGGWLGGGWSLGRGTSDSLLGNSKFCCVLLVFARHFIATSLLSPGSLVFLGDWRLGGGLGGRGLRGWLCLFLRSSRL